MKVLDNRVIIELKKSGITTRNGLLIPTTNSGILEEAVIYKAGEKCVEVKDGDIVLIHYADGRELKIDGKDYIIIREVDIQCIIKRELKNHGT